MDVLWVVLVLVLVDLLLPPVSTLHSHFCVSRLVIPFAGFSPAWI